MATTKKPPAKTATKPSTGRALVPWEEQMRARANKVKKTEKPMSFSKKIGTRGGILTVDDEPIKDNNLDVVVIGWLHENQLYEGEFTPGQPTVPVCYAFNDPNDEDADPEDTMGAHKEAEKPQGTDEEWAEGEAGNACSGCWANKMGTAEKGRGKACKNVRRLMVITPDALESAEAMANAEMRQLSVPVMSVKFWTKFANGVADDLGRDPSGVVCNISTKQDAKANFVVLFDYREPIEFTQELWDAMEKKRAEAMRELLSPYPKQSDLDANAQPVQPRGRMAQAMARGGAKGKPAAPARKGKF